MSALGKTDWAGAQNSGARSVLSMTQGTIYNYVSSKDDILYVVCHRIVAEYNEQARRTLDASHDPWDAFDPRCARSRSDVSTIANLHISLLQMATDVYSLL
jgi:hypothetical protein